MVFGALFAILCDEYSSDHVWLPIGGLILMVSSRTKIEYQ